MLACCSVPDYRELMRMAAAGRDRGRKAEERVATGTPSGPDGAASVAKEDVMLTDWRGQQSCTPGGVLKQLEGATGGGPK